VGGAWGCLARWTGPIALLSLLLLPVCTMLLLLLLLLCLCRLLMLLLLLLCLCRLLTLQRLLRRCLLRALVRIVFLPLLPCLLLLPTPCALSLHPAGCCRQGAAPPQLRRQPLQLTRIAHSLQQLPQGLDVPDGAQPLQQPAILVVPANQAPARRQLSSGGAVAPARRQHSRSD
jgi:hypothetical protein